MEDRFSTMNWVPLKWTAASTLTAPGGGRKVRRAWAARSGPPPQAQIRVSTSVTSQRQPLRGKMTSAGVTCRFSGSTSRVDKSWGVIFPSAPASIFKGLYAFVAEGSRVGAAHSLRRKDAEPGGPYHGRSKGNRP